jgi:hypothetical protein
MKWLTLLALVAGFTMAAATVQQTTVLMAQQRIPDVVLEVTVQQREDGKLDRGLHVLKLVCFDSRCSLTTVSLNQCHQSGEGKPAFAPVVERSSTSEGNLSVTREGRTLVVRESGADLGGDYVNNFRFEYALPASGLAATKLVSFSGGFVKNSVLLKKVITIEYVPLPRPFQVVALDCGVLLPGLQTK